MSQSRASRSTEAPMDFQWTDRPSANSTPAWAASTSDPSTPRKRNREDSVQGTLETPRTPAFGSNHNVPFIFQSSPAPQTPPTHAWVPPPNFSAAKAFPKVEELHDVDMVDPSPPKPDDRKAENRLVATGGLRRVFKARMARERSIARIQQDNGDNSHGEEDSDEELDEITPLTQNTSNHYTLNIPPPAPPQSDMPYILLGYLQFFFNLSLILLFLYLALQFILTVQRDVEQRISEYSMEIVQEIAMCSLQYKNNQCATNPIPAMVQLCSEWEACMNRDPTIVGRAKVGAEMIAEVVNGFVEPISWKTLIFTLTSLSFLTVFINTLLSLYRSRHHPIPAVPTIPPQPFPHPSATPYPAHQYGSYLPLPPTPGWGRMRIPSEDPQTPTRRRRVEGGGAVKIK